MASKREREYQHRRYEKWQQRQAEHDAARRRQRIVVGSVVGALVLVIAVVAVVTATTDDGTPTAEVTPSATEGAGATVPDPALAEDRTWTGDIALKQGDIGITLDGKAAPQAVANFVTLADKGYFDTTTCHRLTTEGIYVLQCGSPDGTSSGGPGYSWGPIENAPADNVYPAGTIAMARVGNDGSSMGSQFFLVYKDSTIPSDSAGGYTVFGQITSGDDVLKTIADAGTTAGTDGPPVHDVIIEGVKVK